MPAGPETEFPSPEKICAPRLIPFSPKNHFRQIQKASIGCNIKWKSGNEPDYF